MFAYVLPRVSMWILGTELGSSCLGCKRFSYWWISPAGSCALSISPRTKLQMNIFFNSWLLLEIKVQADTSQKPQWPSQKKLFTWIVHVSDDQLHFSEDVWLLSGTLEALKVRHLYLGVRECGIPSTEIALCLYHAVQQRKTPEPPRAAYSIWFLWNFIMCRLIPAKYFHHMELLGRGRNNRKVKPWISTWKSPRITSFSLDLSMWTLYTTGFEVSLPAPAFFTRGVYIKYNLHSLTI